MKKTGEVLFREEDGSLWLAESFIDENGKVTTQQYKLEDAPVKEEE